MNKKGPFKLNGGAVALLSLLFCVTLTTISGSGPGIVNLGTAGDFVILTKSGVTTTGTTVVTGDVGTSPIASTAITGFGLVLDSTKTFSNSSLVAGKVYAADYTAPTPAKMTAAISDMETAFTDAAGRTLPDFIELHGGFLTGHDALVPGLYKWSTSVGFTDRLIFNGSSTDTWILQIAKDVNVGAGASVILEGGALPENIFWQVSGTTAIAGDASIQGIILCYTAITFASATSLIGRALAQTAVTMSSTTIRASPASESPTVSIKPSLTMNPSYLPTNVPSQTPTVSIKPSLTMNPSSLPTDVPSQMPTVSIKPSISSNPSSLPTDTPSQSPTVSIKPSLSTNPSFLPTDVPSENPTDSIKPSLSKNPSYIPTDIPSQTPTVTIDPSLSTNPSYLPTDVPSEAPTVTIEPSLSTNPSSLPTDVPSETPTDSIKPSLSMNPSSFPTNPPSETPTISIQPSLSTNPSSLPTDVPSETPTVSTQPSISTNPSSLPTDIPSQTPTVTIQPSISANPSSLPTQVPTQIPTVSIKPSLSTSPTSLPTDIPSQNPTDSIKPSITTNPSSLPTYVPSETPTVSIMPSLSTKPNSPSPSSQPTSPPSNPQTSESPSNLPTSSPSTSPPAPSLEEALLSDKLFGPSGTTCSNYIPENGEYSFTFDLSSLPYFDDTLSDVEEIMFQVQMSHTDWTNSNRTWAIKVGTGGHIYSFQGPYGDSIPPNTNAGMLFVDEVNQKVCVDSVKNSANNEHYFIHQSGVYQDGDPGYTDTMPVWFSPNVAIYCSLIIPECRLASWGQQSMPRAWSERVIYYDRYRDCGDGILERTHIIHNAELESTDTVLTFTNMPWGGTRYSTLKDFVISQNPDTWNYDQYELPGGVEDPMLVFAQDKKYGAGVNRVVTSTWTLGYTIFAQDLPFVEYPLTPPFAFPGRLPAEDQQPSFVADYGKENTRWICQGPLNGYTHPDTGNYRCRFANLGVAMTKGCNQCYLRLTNYNGESFAIFNVRHWLYWDASLKVYLMYFNSDETSSTIKNVVTNGTTITVAWDETGKSPEDNLALAFVHGTSEQMVGDNYPPSRIRYGHSNNVQRDFAVFEYISFPNLSFGDSYRARQYYITDQFTGLSDRSKALASDTIEEVIQSGQFEMSQIHLHYINDGQVTTFGSTIDDYPCNNIHATALACTGSSTPQVGKNAFLQMDCGASTYVGTDFYHFSNFPTAPYRVMNCTIDGETTSTRPSVKLLGYFTDVDCGTTLQDKTFDPNFCNN